mmetsp:Transcript_18379/g.40998  ORF Transcript_18379/g.40998 Transcript_18379/m.40998 type:complete len:246 (-) Transcript_18379:730-1467(-)
MTRKLHFGGAPVRTRSSNSSKYTTQSKKDAVWMVKANIHILLRMVDLQIKHQRQSQSETRGNLLLPQAECTKELILEEPPSVQTLGHIVQQLSRQATTEHHGQYCLGILFSQLLILIQLAQLHTSLQRCCHIILQLKLPCKALDKLATFPQKCLATVYACEHIEHLAHHQTVHDTAHNHGEANICNLCLSNRRNVTKANSGEDSQYKVDRVNPLCGRRRAFQQGLTTHIAGDSPIQPCLINIPMK